MRRLLLIVTGLLLATHFLVANIRHVPSFYPTIQQGIDSSSHGDTVLVAHGTYYENINFRGKKILLASQYLFTRNQSDIEQTVINGSQPAHPDTASCVLFISGEDTNSVLEGFTLTGGLGTLWRDIHNNNRYREGGGILLEFTSPIIRYNIIRNNDASNPAGGASAGGGGIRIGDANPRVIGNIIAYNRGRYGGGIVLNYTGATIRNNVIYRNTGGEDYGGSGIWASNSGGGGGLKLIENNTIVENSSATDGCGILVSSTSATIRNNIIWGNTAPADAQLALAGGTFSVTYNDVEGGYPGTGNIALDPKFMDTTHYLQGASPCIDAGDPAPQYNDPEDSLSPGSALAPSRGTLRNDMGAFGGKSRSSLYVRIHLNAPRPPANLDAYSDHLTPSSVTLTWLDPAELYNGAVLEDFTLRIYRDSVFIASVDSGVGSFVDTGLVLHQQYGYLVAAVTAIDSSPPASASAYAGGSAIPRPPSAFVAHDGMSGVVLSWTNPARQADDTPLNDLAKILVYRDAVLVESLAQSPADTGAARTYADTALGYHIYWLAARDDESPLHTSAPTGSLFGYGGVTTAYSESFEAGSGDIYATGTWDTTSARAHGGGYSLADSPGANYTVGTNTSVLLPPVIIGSRYVLEFQNIAVVRGGHFAYVEISTDRRTTYTALKTYNWFLNAAWADGVADSSDWVKYTFDLSAYAGDTATIRLRLNTGTGMNADGWYIDNVVVGPGDAAAASAYAFDPSWNMISVPRELSTTVPDSVYGGASGHMFGYNGAYFAADSLRHSVGYWAKFDAARICSLGGTALLRDTFMVHPRWNMVGSISYPVDSASIKASPAGIIQSSFYTYTSDSGYVVCRTLLPGKAYWVKVSQAGKLLPSIFYPAAAPSAEPKAAAPAELGRLRFSDALGRTAELALVEGAGAGALHELPPSPPVGAFDIRFASDRSAESVDADAGDEHPVILRSVSYPLRIEWSCGADRPQGAVLDVGGEPRTLGERTELVLTQPPARLSIRMSSGDGGILPAEFALTQNYPNPFNPSTTVRYQVPAESRVILTVFNILGEEMATIVDAVETAGYRSARWNAESVPSGVYYCRMVAGSFRRTIKMIVMK